MDKHAHFFKNLGQFTRQYWMAQVADGVRVDEANSEQMCREGSNCSFRLGRAA